jgi:O-acetyl-ADP-ribose deacetylase (regulator of RNase III)
MNGKGGIDGAIHKAAGDELLRACNIHKKIRPGVLLPTGRSRILLSYEMSSTTHYIINTASPHFDQYPSEEAKKRLISCYKTSLALANLYQLETISFPAISCGENGFVSRAFQ